MTFITLNFTQLYPPKPTKGNRTNELAESILGTQIRKCQKIKLNSESYSWCQERNHCIDVLAVRQQQISDRELAFCLYTIGDQRPPMVRRGRLCLPNSNFFHRDFNIFSVNKTSGTVFLHADSIPSKDIFRLLVAAIDNGTQRLESVASVIVSISTTNV